MTCDNETVEQVCEEMRNDWAMLYYSEGTRCNNGEYPDVNVIETQKVSDRILAAHKREIAAADVEIASLRELVGEMTVALPGALDIIGNVAEYIEVDVGTMLRVETYREILAKARDVCNA